MEWRKQQLWVWCQKRGTSVAVFSSATAVSVPAYNMIANDSFMFGASHRANGYALPLSFQNTESRLHQLIGG